MKSILLVGMLASLAISGIAPLHAEDQPKAASVKHAAVVRKVTVQLLDKEGKKLAETAVPSLQEDQSVEWEASVPLTQPGTKRWRVDLTVNVGGASPTALYVTIYDLDRAIAYESDKGQQVLPMQEILSLNTAYTGPGTYEIYRSLEEKLVVVIE